MSHINTEFDETGMENILLDDSDLEKQETGESSKVEGELSISKIHDIIGVPLKGNTQAKTEQSDSPLILMMEMMREMNEKAGESQKEMMRELIEKAGEMNREMLRVMKVDMEKMEGNINAKFMMVEERFCKAEENSKLESSEITRQINERFFQFEKNYSDKEEKVKRSIATLETKVLSLHAISQIDNENLQAQMKQDSELITQNMSTKLADINGKVDTHKRIQEEVIETFETTLQTQNEEHINLAKKNDSAIAVVNTEIESMKNEIKIVKGKVVHISNGNYFTGTVPGGSFSIQCIDALLKEGMTYSGKLDSAQHPMEFLKTVERKFEIYQVTEEQKLGIVMCCLKETAVQWARDCQPDSYDAFKTMFTNMYWSQVHQHRLLKYIYSGCYDPNKGVGLYTYVACLLRNASYLSQASIMTEQILISAVIQHLPGQIRMLLYNVSTKDELLLRLSQMEEDPFTTQLIKRSYAPQYNRYNNNRAAENGTQERRNEDTVQSESQPSTSRPTNQENG